MDDGLFPYTKRYLGTLRNHFSTIGVNGVNEMVRNFTGRRHDITPEWGHRLRAAARSRERPDSPLPGGDRAPVQPRGDARRGHDVSLRKGGSQALPGDPAGGHGGIPYYTNSSQLPVGFTDDPFEALTRQDELQRKYTGGTVLHLYMGERCRPRRLPQLVRRALERFPLPYITVTPTFSICPTHGYLSGEQNSAEVRRSPDGRRAKCGRGSWATTGRWPRSTSARRASTSNADSFKSHHRLPCETRHVGT